MRDAIGAPLAVHAADAQWLREDVTVWPHAVTRWGWVMRTVGMRVLARLPAIEAVEPDVVVGDEGLDLEPYGVGGKVCTRRDTRLAPSRCFSKAARRSSAASP